MTDQHVHLSFGPVQEFLAQARRTRDLWSGSYLLSYLAGSALLHAKEAGANVLLPSLEGNPLFAALELGQPPSGAGDRVGSIPHVAELVVAEGRAEAVASAAEAGWMAAWRRVADAVRTHLRQRAAAWTSATDAIWLRQVGAAWSVTWAVGDAGMLGRRKSLRAFTVPAEPGEKCTCCGVRETLRGEQPARADIRTFWSVLAEAFGRYEVIPNGAERLCAICAIKRFWPLWAHGAIGWDVPLSFPSTVTMASLDWRRDLLHKGKGNPDVRSALRAHLQALEDVGAQRGGALDAFPSLQDAATSWGREAELARRFLGYDGDWFYPEEIDQHAKQAAIAGDPLARLHSSLRALQAAAVDAAVTPPRTAYALLMMDGDNMGKLLSSHEQHKAAISQALGAFSRQAIDLVESRQANGRLIYAGGDDILAVLPVESALPTAAALRRAYRDAFVREAGAVLVHDEVKPSISAGLVYAHMHAPLRQVLTEARRLLDDVAKDRADRDAFAVAVWKRPGPVLEFAAKWGDGVETTIEKVVDGARDDMYSTGFLYHTQDVEPARRALDERTRLALLAAEYLQRRAQPVTIAEAQQRVKHIDQLTRCTRPEPSADAVLFAAYLAKEDN